MTVFSLSYNFNQGTVSAPKNNGSVVTIQNNRDNTRTQTFTYDPLNRIAIAETPNSSLWGNTYVIDAWGNLTNKNMISGKGGENLQTSALTNNQLTGMTYDIAGNEINDGMGDTYVYDAENRLISAGGISTIYMEKETESKSVPRVRRQGAALRGRREHVLERNVWRDD